MTFPINGFTPKSNVKSSGLSGDVKLTQPTVKSPVFNFNEVKEFGRKELSLVNNFNDWDMTISGAKEIAADTNKIMASLGYKNYKVTTGAVERTSQAVQTYQNDVAKLDLSNNLKDYLPKSVSFDEQLEIASHIEKNPMPEIV